MKWTVRRGTTHFPTSWAVTTPTGELFAAVATWNTAWHLAHSAATAEWANQCDHPEEVTC